MRQIADVDDIEQPDGSFPQRRTHTLDPEQPSEFLQSGRFPAVFYWCLLTARIVSKIFTPSTNTCDPVE
jgi:hypothetical protein